MRVKAFLPSSQPHVDGRISSSTDPTAVTQHEPLRVIQTFFIANTSSDIDSGQSGGEQRIMNNSIQTAYPLLPQYPALALACSPRGSRP